MQNASVRCKWTPPVSTDVELTDRKATIVPRKEENDVDLTVWACNAFGVGTGGVERWILRLVRGPSHRGCLYCSGFCRLSGYLGNRAKCSAFSFKFHTTWLSGCHLHQSHKRTHFWRSQNGRKVSVPLSFVTWKAGQENSVDVLKFNTPFFISNTVDSYPRYRTRLWQSLEQRRTQLADRK